MKVLRENAGILGLTGISAKTLLTLSELEKPLNSLVNKEYVEHCVLDAGDCIKTKIYKLTPKGRKRLEIEGEENGRD